MKRFKTTVAAALTAVALLGSLGFTAACGPEDAAEPAAQAYVSPYDWSGLERSGDRLAFRENGEVRSQLGVDVSDHQGAIDWSAVASEGVDFATLQGSEILKADLPPFIAVPTTAGTGSEVTLVAVVADTHKHAKLSFTSYKLVPHVAILDPALTSSLPPKLTATTGMDALTHAVEAHTSIQKNPVSDAFAAKAVALIAANLPTACRNGADTEARTSLALASLMAGAAFSNAMVGIVHAIGHSLGGLCRIPHGQAMMMLLPHCVRFNLDRGIHAGLYGQLLDVLAPARAAALGAGAAPEALDRAFLDELTALNDLFHREYGVPLTLSELGVSRDDLPAVAKQARYDGAALYNETEITLEDAMAVLEAAY